MTYAVAVRATRDPELAEDVTQEAFIKLLTEARAGRCPDNAGAWLYRAVSNLVISRARRAEVARRLAPRLLDIGAADQPDVIAARRESQAELRTALAVLSPDERTALLLSASGATGLEISARLGRSHGARRALMCRARTRLRDAAEARATAGCPARPPAAATVPVRRRTTPVWAVAGGR
jgi:RNA polymerase sigma-70 factor (ECF subfamily)